MKPVREKTFFCRYCGKDKPQKGRAPTRPGCYKCADCITVAKARRPITQKAICQGEHGTREDSLLPSPVSPVSPVVNPNVSELKGQANMKPDIPMLSTEAFCLSEAWLLIFNQRRRAGDLYDHAKATPCLVDAGPHGILERPIMEVDIRGKRYYADAVTGSLYDHASGACMTSTLRLLDIAAQAA